VEAVVLAVMLGVVVGFLVGYHFGGRAARADEEEGNHGQGEE
jgi:membrane protein DedA with SNARE-associated domain